MQEAASAQSFAPILGFGKTNKKKKKVLFN
jgi:hypothetical protein